MIKGTLFALVCAVSYAMNPVLIKVGYGLGIEPLPLMQYRFLFAALFMTAYFGLTAPRIITPTKPLLRKGAVITFAIVSPMNVFYAHSMQYIPASLMSLITYMFPVVVLAITALVLKTPVRKASYVSVAIILAACVCIFSDAFMQQISAYGILLGVIAMIFYSLYMVALQVFMKNESPESVTYFVVLLTALAYLFISNPLAILGYTWAQIGLCMVYALISTVICTIFLCKAIAAIGAAEAGIFCSFEPFFTVVFAVLLLGESIFPLRVLGLVLLIAGIIVPNFHMLQLAVVQYRKQ